MSKFKFDSFRSNRNARQESVKKSNKKKQLEFFAGELEKRQLMATFSYSSNVLTIQTNSDAETFSIAADTVSGNYTITSSVNFTGTDETGLVGNGATTLTVGSDLSLNSIVMSDNNGTNSGASLSFATSTGNFIDNLSVNFSNATSGTISAGNATSFIDGANLSLTSAGNAISVSAPITANSTGSITLTAACITVTNTAGDISTETGDITFNANSAGTFQSGTFNGIALTNANVNITTTGGNIVLVGRAGSTIGSGIEGYNHGNITAGGNGTISLTGYSNSTSASNRGVWLTTGTVSTSNGSITLVGSTVSGDHGFGMYAETVSAGGIGSVSITGCNTWSAGAEGIFLNSLVETNGGDITLTANSIRNMAYVNATSSGIVRIQTLGASIDLGGPDSSANLGFDQSELDNITAGCVTIGNSTAGAITNTEAISRTGNLSLVSGGTITQTGAGNLAVSGTANVVAVGNNITLANATNDFGTFTANGGNVSVTDTNSLTVGSITATGGVSVTTDQTLGCISVTGPINTTGGSGGVTLTGQNVQVTGNITTAAGDIAIYGNGGGSYQAGSFRGVNITGPSVNITSSSGNITIDGRAGVSGACGVSISHAVISTSNNGALSITGVSGNGSATSAYGIDLEGGSTNLLTMNGLISLTGTSNSTGSSSDGFRLNNINAIKASGSGSISITGYSGLSGTDQNGIRIYRNYSGNMVESSTGNITLNGISRGSDSTSEGVQFLVMPGIYAANGGSIFIDGTTANASALAIDLNDLGDAQGSSIVANNGGAINFTANSFGITGNAIISATISGNVNFYSKGAVIDLGGSDTTSNLGISNAEISKITANVLTIGNSTAGAITNTAAISRTGNLSLVSGGTITQTGAGNLAVSGTANVIAVGNNITLANATNDFGTFTANGAGVSVRDSNALALGSIRAANLTVSAGGAVTQSAASNVTGTANISASGFDITLANTSNDFGTFTANGAGVSVTDTNSLTVGAITATGGVSVTTNQTLGCISVTGPINTTGGSGGVTLTGRNVQVTGNITTAAGDIAIYGNGGGSYQTGSFRGVYITGPSVNITSSSGNITIDGRGGVSGACGVWINQASIVTGNNGSLSISGLSGNGAATSAYGIYMGDGSTNLLTVNGSINLTGTSNSTGSNSEGFRLNNIGIIKASGSGSISITGYSGLSGSGQNGIFFYRNYTGNVVESSTGNITLNGISRGNSNTSEGIHFHIVPGIYSANGGSIFFDGTTANASALAISLVDGSNTQGTPIVTRNGGSINFTANSFEITGNAAISAGLTGNVNFYSKGATIDLGGSDSTSNLGISNAEINKITAKVLTIGNSTAGAIVNTAAISRNNATLGTNLTLISSGSISQIGSGTIVISGTANFVAAGNDITLGNATNNFGTFTANGANVSVTDANALALGSITAGNLTVSVVGAVTQSAAASVSGTANFISSGTGTSGNITLNNATNDFGTVTACGTNITIYDNSALTLGTITGNNTITIVAQNLTIDSTVNATGSGSISLVPTSGVTIDLGTKSTGNFGLTSAEINNITAGTLTIGDAASSQIRNTQPIYRTNTTLGTNLTLVTSGGITQVDAGNFVVAGTAAFRYPSGVIQLNNATNNFYSTGSINANGGPVTIYNSNATTLGLTKAATLTVNSTGAISQIGRIDLSYGSANLISTGCITLADPTNEIPTIYMNGTDANISTANSIDFRTVTVNNLTITSGINTRFILGNTTVGGNLNVSALGDIYQINGGNVNVSGNVNLTSGGQVLLNFYGTNRFGGIITVNGGWNVYIASNQNMTFGNVISGNMITLQGYDVTLTDNISANSQVDLSVNTANLSNNITITANNADILAACNFNGNKQLSLLAGTGNIEFGYSGNLLDVSRLTATGNNITIDGSGNFALNNITAGDTVNITDSNITNIIGSYVAPTTLLNNGTLTVATQMQTNLTISGSVSSANLQTGGNITGNVASGGCLTTAISISNLTLTGGFVTVTNGTTNVSAGTGYAEVNVTGGTFSANATLGNVTVASGATANLTDGTANVVSVSGGTLLSGADLTSLSVASGSTASISGGTVTTATSAGTLNGTGGVFTALDVTGGNTTLSGGSVTNLANVTGGLLVSSVNLGSLEVGASGTANISGGSIGTTTNAGTLNGAGGTFASVASSNSTTLTGATVTGLSNVTGGTFTANATLGIVTVGGGTANLTDGTANVVSVSGGTLLSAADLTSLSVASGSTATISGGTVTTASSAGTLNGTGGVFTALDVTGGNTTLSGGSVTNLANVTGGLLVSSVNLGSLEVGASGTANISAGSIGNTTNAGTLNGTGGTFASVASSGTTSLTGATVTGLSNVTGGTFTANTTLGNITVASGATADLTGGTANVATVSGTLLTTANLTSLSVNANGTANVTGGVVSTAASAGTLNQTGGNITTLTVTGGTSTISGGQIDGLANVTGGTLVSSQNLGSLNVSANGTANVTGGVVSTAASAGTLNQTGGNITTLTVTGGTSTISGGQIDGLANVTGGTLVSSRNLGSLNVSANGTANVTGGVVSTAASAGTLNQTGGNITTLTVTGGTSTISGGQIDGLANVTGGTLVSSQNLGSLNVSANGTANISNGTIASVTSGAAYNQTGGSIGTLTVLNGRSNITGGTVSNTIDVLGGHADLGGTQQGDLNVNTTGAVVINTPIAGLTTVTNSCLTTVNANLTGGLTINAATGHVYLNPDVTISVGATTITGNVTNQIVPVNTTLASLAQSNGTVSLNGTVTGLANVTRGTLNSSGQIGDLAVGANGTANLTGGSLNGNSSSAGTLITAINLSNVTVSAGSVTVNGGTTNITSGSGTSASVVTGNLVSAANLTSLSVASGTTANISGGTVTTATSAGELNGTGGVFTSLDVTGGNTTLSAGSVTNLANVSGGSFTSAVNLGSLSTSDGTTNITGGIISGDINVNGGHITLAGTQQGNLNVNTTGAVDINTAIGGLTTVTNSCLTRVGANLTGGLTINAATGSVYFYPNVAISVGATTVTGNVSNQIVPANTTLASLDQSNGTVDLSGTVTGLANVTGGTLNSSGEISSLTVGTDGTANLTGGNVTGATATSGSLTVGSGAGINTLVVNNGTSSVSGSVSGDASVNDGSLTLVNGSTAAGNVSVNHGNLYANGTIGGALTVGTLGGHAEVQSGGVVQGVTNVSATGTLVVAGQLQQSLNIIGSGASANVTTTGNVTGQTTVNTGGSVTTDGALRGGLNVNNGTVNTYASGTSIALPANLTLGSASTWTANGSSVANYGTISAPSVTIASGANLTLDAGFTMANESAFTLINNTGIGAISGTFYGLPEGSRLVVGGNNVTLSYYGGSGGNDVVLYRTGGLSTVVNTNLDLNNATDNLITLREAINYARLNALSSGNPQDITFDASALFGGSNANTITLSNATDYGVLVVNQNSTLSIIGPEVNTANSLTVSGGGVTGIFSLTTATNISNMTLAGANGDVGGAIFNNATSTLNDMTIQDNFASGGGGLWNHENGDLTIINSTFANNTATSMGGAIENVGGIISIRQSTIAYNSVVSGSGSGGGLNKIGGSVTLLNTIVANNTASQGPDIFASVNANNSLIGDDTDAIINGSDNLTDVTALLGTLNYYGGTTKVYPLLPGSPAIDSGSGTGVTDQRGITVAGAADIGSFQSRGFNITKTGGGNEVAMIGDAFPTALKLNITSSYNEPVVGGVVSFTFANSTGGGTSSNGTGFTAATSQATIVQNANVSDGNITLTAIANANYSNQTYTALGNATGANAAASYVMTNVGTPDSITITAGNYQSGPLTGNFSQTLGINVKDSVGNNIPRLTVTFSPQTTAYGASGTINSNSVYSAATDSNGNITGLTYASNGIGGLVTIVANATVASNSVRPAGTALNNFQEGASGYTIQNGLIGRSFVNNVDAVLGNASLAANLVSTGNVRIKYLGLNGTTPAANTTGIAIPIAGVTGNVTFNYGSTGIGGNQNSDQGDGIYQLEVDYTGNNFANATQVTTVKFHRLFGDVNGDKIVDTADYASVTDRTVYGRYGIFSQDTNGAGRVYTKDLQTTLRQRGRRVSNYNQFS